MMDKEQIQALQKEVKSCVKNTDRVEKHVKELRLHDRLHEVEGQVVELTKCCMALLQQVKYLTDRVNQGQAQGAIPMLAIDFKDPGGPDEGSAPSPILTP